MAQASPAVNPSVDFLAMSRRIPFMDEQQLASLTATKEYGSLALAEVSRRNRERLMAEAAKQAQSAGGSGTVADRELAALAQQQFADKLAADESMGLNNLVAQAEQGGLEFGEPVEMAGGGMIAFEKGGKVNQAGERYYDDPELGRVYEDGSLGYVGFAAALPAIQGARALGPLALRGLTGLREVIRRNPKKTTALTGIASGVPFGLGMMGEDEEGAFTPEELQRQYEVQDIQEGRGGSDVASAGRGIAGKDIVAAARRRGLGLEDDPKKILQQIKDLEKEQGLGEFGAKTKELQAKRRGDIESMYAKAGESEPFLKAAKAVGGKRKSGLEALAAAVGAGGESMAELRREKAGAMDKLAQGEERMALAEEQYLRGNIKDYYTMANQAKKDIFSADIKLQELGMKQSYYDALGLAAKAKASGGAGFKLGDVTRATQAINELQNQLRMLDPKKDKQAIAETQRLIQILKGGVGMAYARGTGATLEDTAD
jgi:hypothetical protein